MSPPPVLGSTGGGAEVVGKGGAVVEPGPIVEHSSREREVLLLQRGDPMLPVSGGLDKVSVQENKRLEVNSEFEHPSLKAYD